ncbi:MULTISPECIES: response regulator [Streptomyces]|uniref:LuxR family transcriptional regulator n=2 Tax=Streptomyces TaxID=1883 RepID=A0A2N8PAS9_STRNR|nr:MULTISPECIES: response regulator transcription factor [Streptomyces]PNE38129.1 LuxR family transcriptional regulator [Streptomyces noursei]SHL84676.1 two component transcriptional regulator, LuxR family [Streptomyces yunnanensis]
MIRVLLVDDEALVRAGVRLVLQHADDIEVVAEAGDGARAVELAVRERPDVVLLDVRMPGMDGLDALARLTALEPPAAVVMLSTFGDEENVTRALRAGADGFLLKHSGPEELINAVRAAAQGDAVLSPGVTAHVVRAMRDEGRGNRTRAADERIAALTDREREVLAMLGAGLANAEIARRLGVGTGTVKVHVGRILAKLGAANRVQAAIIAHEAGLADRT